MCLLATSSPKLNWIFSYSLTFFTSVCVCASRSVFSNSLRPHGGSPASSVEFARHEYWHGLPFSSPGYLPDPGIEPGSPTLQADSLPSEAPGNPQPHIYIQDQSPHSLPQIRPHSRPPTASQWRCHSSSPPGESPLTFCFSHCSAPLLHAHFCDVCRSFPSLLLPIPYWISGPNSSL